MCNITILFEDNHLIVVNKKPSDIVQGDKTGDETLGDKVKTYIKEKYNKPGNVFLGVTHRLDRPTSGLVIFAKTSKALERMNEIFKDKKIEKIYWAVVEKAPLEKEKTLISYLKKNEKQNKSYVSLTEKEGFKKAELSYRMIGHSDKYFFLEIYLKTGRHHQIRAQLASIGCIIKGDLKYGAKRSNQDKSIHLHSRYASFVHPITKETIEITANPPNEVIWNVMLKVNDQVPK
jgi:23S rRNA pseudouridine1911/1915/1917 synthase